MKAGAGGREAAQGAGFRETRSLVRGLQMAIMLVTLVPLFAFSLLIFRYVSPSQVEMGLFVAVLVAVMLLMLSGTRMIFRLTSSIQQAALGGAAPLRLDAVEPQAILGGKSIRQTVAEATALIGAIPLLAIGYIVVRYVHPLRTTESVLLITFMVSAVMFLSIAQIRGIIRRIISVAVDARNVRMGSGPAGRDLGEDEIGALSSDLSHIAGTLTARLSELRRAMAFVERLPHPLCVVGRSGVVELVNHAALQMLGYGERELMGREAASLFARAEDPEWILGKRGEGARETEWLRKDGTRVPVSVRIGSLASGEVTSASLMVATDLSEREQAKAAIRESEGRYRSVFDNSPVSLWEEDMSGIKSRLDELRASGVNDIRGHLDDHPEEVKRCLSLLRIVDVNRATLDLFEAGSEEEMRREATPLFTEETFATFKEELIAVAAGRLRFSCDTDARTLKGAKKLTQLSWSVVPGYERSYARVLVCITDITDQKRVERELRRERERLQTYMDVAAVMFVVIGADERVALINRKGCEILGRAEKEIVGKNWFDAFVPPRVREEVREVFRDVLAGRREWREYFEDPVLTGSGEERIVAWHNAFLRDERGAIVGTLSSGTDITERRRMEEQLRHAQKMQAIVTLAGGIAHDFNNILAGIIGYASLLSARAGKDRVLLGDVTSIQKLSWKGAGLVKELLAFARRDEFSPAPVDLNRLIRDVLSFVGETVGQRVTIRTDLSPGTPRVLGDVQQLYQLIMNLAFNGCESMPNGGTLSVTIATAVTDDAFFRCHPGLTAGPYVALTVSDTGEGIDEKIRERIFEPFFTTRESKMGRGLGLSVASGIAERHGGCINVESASGKGSVFTVYLPAIPATP